jgi:hypothetical protein
VTVAARAPGRLPAVVAALFWVGVPIVCALMLWQGSTQLATRSHDTPPGIRGNFVVTMHDCEQRLCITTGTFTSDDNTMDARNLLGLSQWKVASVHRVAYDADVAGVTPLPADWDLTGAVLGIVGALVLLGIWGWSVRAVRRR